MVTILFYFVLKTNFPSTQIYLSLDFRLFHEEKKPPTQKKFFLLPDLTREIKRASPDLDTFTF